MADAAVADAAAAVAAPASGAVEPWYKDWMGTDGSLNAKSYDRLPDHLKGLRPTLERQPNIEGVLQALDHANTLAGKKALAPLMPDAPEQVRTERKALLDQINGVPKEAKEYGVSRPKEIPEHQWNQALADGFVGWCHKNSVAPAAVKELMSLQLGEVGKQLASQKQNEDAFWTGQAQKFEAKIKAENIASPRAQALIDKAIVAFGFDAKDPETANWLKGANTRYMLMKHAMTTGEDTALTGSEPETGKGQDYAALAASVRTDQSNPLFGPYWNKGGKYSRADQEAAREKVNGWLRLLTQQQEAKAAQGAR